MASESRLLPEDFDGPICAKCKHLHIPNVPNPQPREWRCGFGAPVVVVPAHRDPVTGKVSKALHEQVWCIRKNEAGDCADFEAKAVSPWLRMWS